MKTFMFICAMAWKPLCAGLVLFAVYWGFKLHAAFWEHFNKGR